jgi:F-type H+-transporting ATPase subunit b
MTGLATVVLAAEGGGGGGGGIGLLLPHTYELIWGTIGFAILMVVMRWKVFPTLNETLENRQKAIQGRLEEAEAAKEEAERLRRQYEDRLAEAREQADEIIAEARTRAERVREDLIKRAEDEASEIVERSKADQEAERRRLVQELRAQVADLSLVIASKIVGRELEAGRHEDLIDEYIEQLSSLNGR